VHLPSPLTPGRLIAAAVAVAIVVVGGRVWLTGSALVDADTVEVTRGEYADIVEIRGQIAPVRTTVVTAPYNAGELQILKIASNGTDVKAGDIVAEFDAINLRRTIEEKQGELRSAQAELEQGEAQSRITVEERKAAVYKAEFEVQRAELSLGEVGLISEIDAERARLALADASQRLREAEAAAASAEANALADREARARRIAKVQAELALAERQVNDLHVTAPSDGSVSIMPNYRSTNPMGVPQEFRAGDRAYAGAMILELPDLSSVYLTARIDEADRGLLSAGQPATIRVDAIADRDYQATVTEISLLARTDFTSGWPPRKQFDLTLSIVDPDERLRPGMSAGARVAVGQLPDVLLVPAASVSYEDGRTVVFRQSRRGYEAVPVEILRRGRDQAAVTGELEPGDRIARQRPGAAPEEVRP